MQLYVSRTSPYARKALVLAHEVGLVDKIEVIETNPFDSAPELLAHNPLSKIPTLVTHDDQVLYDSRVICEYLDSLHDGLRFIPAGSSRWRVLRFAALAEGLMDATVALRLESLRPEAQQSEEAEARYLRAVRRSLQRAEAELDELRAEPTVAHLGLGCALAYLDLRLASEPWRDNHEGLARWFTAWSNRPSMVATAPPRA